jgi:hypothetical protein
MKVNSIIFLLSFTTSFLSSSALEKPSPGIISPAEKRSKDDDNRNLQINFFTDLACRNQLRRCNAVVGPQPANLQEWSAFLRATPDIPGNLILGSLRSIVAQAGLVNFTEILDNVPATLDDTRLSDLVDASGDLMGALGDLLVATSKGQLTFALDLLQQIFALIHSVVGAVVNTIVAILNSIVDIIFIIVNAEVNLFKSLLDIIHLVINAVVDFIVGLFSAIFGIFSGGRIGTDSVCQIDLQFCNYEKFLFATVPNLLTASFLVAGTGSLAADDTPSP